MASMAELLSALGDLVDAYTAEILGLPGAERLAGLLDHVVDLRERCAQSARRQSRAALADADAEQPSPAAREWMSYTALLVQVDRVLDDLRRAAARQLITPTRPAPWSSW